MYYKAPLVQIYYENEVNRPYTTGDQRMISSPNALELRQWSSAKLEAPASTAYPVDNLFGSLGHAALIAISALTFRPPFLLRSLHCLWFDLIERRGLLMRLTHLQSLGVMHGLWICWDTQFWMTAVRRPSSSDFAHVSLSPSSLVDS